MNPTPYRARPHAAAALAFVAVVLASPAAAQTSSSVTVCVHPAQGFATRDANGARAGIEVDIVSSFAAASGLTAVFEDAPSFDRVLKDTETGACDMGAATITVTADRQSR